ncbi:MAG: DUF523 domain-containing protein [Burkholderiaceae bacterium]|nr:MAG: DUF523 domain-containing protein [Burkholderiaceae bacterium]
MNHCQPLILVSACLVGEPVRYDGGHAQCRHPLLALWQAQGRLRIFCPEAAGGLATPRPPVEIGTGGDGYEVLMGAARVRDASGGDATQALLAGSRAAVDAALHAGIRMAILKDGSPSCGSGFIADGTFSGRRIARQGVTTAALQIAGVRVFSEHRLDEAALFLEELEKSSPPHLRAQPRDWSI